MAAPGTHFIYPAVNGFPQAGGYAGPQVPWNADVRGSLSVAERYMKAAGYKSGKYTGHSTVLIVGANNAFSPAMVQLLNSDLTQLGFKTHVSLVDQSVMYAKYCGVPKQEIDACPTVGWVRDFADPLTVLYVPFYGPAITPTNNSNWGQVNDPQINAAMQKAALVTDPTARAQAWANVDKMLVNQAVAIPEDFDNEPNLESKDVAGVNQLWNDGTWDLDFTSLKNPLPRHRPRSRAAAAPLPWTAICSAPPMPLPPAGIAGSSGGGSSAAAGGWRGSTRTCRRRDPVCVRRSGASSRVRPTGGRCLPHPARWHAP